MTPGQTRISEWLAHPERFVRECLGVTPDAWQETSLLALASNNRMAFKACKGPGKSALLAWIGWWFLTCHPHPKVVCTSITGDNLKDGLWTEFSKWQGRSPFLKGAFEWTAERIFAKAHKETWWASARQWAKSASATQQADTLAGIHADHVLFLIDEAGGIPDAVVAAAEAGLANASEAEQRSAKLILAGNPTHLSGPLYRACTRERHLWWVKEISSAPEDPERTPRVSVQWAQEQIDKYGKDSPWVLVNVYGQFPPGQSDALLGVEEVNAAMKRSLSLADVEEQPKILGVDVARFGDDATAFAPRQGRMGFRMTEYRNVDTMETAHRAAFAYDKWEADGLLVDQTGVGSGVVDKLRELNYPVTGIDAASKPLSSWPKFINRRAEMWWRMSEWVKSGGCLPEDPQLVEELTGPTYWFNAKGQIVLESKDEMKARGLSSPNKADALALTFASPVGKRPIRIPGTPAGRVAATEYDPFSR